MADPILHTRRTRDVLAGGTTKDELRGRAWTRVGHGVVRPTSSPSGPLLDHVARAVAVAGPSGVVGGWAALALQGNGWFDGRTGTAAPRPVAVHCPPGTQVRRRDGVEPFRGLLHPDEVVDLGAYRVTSLARAAFDEMRLAPDAREAAVVLDMATSTTGDVPHTSPAAVDRMLAAHGRARGIVQARQALCLGSTRSASPWETRTRLVATLDAGVPRLEVNLPVFSHDGNLLGVVDLIEPETGLVVEVDGDHHRDRARHAADNRREEALERAGLTVVRVASLDHHDRSMLVRRIRAARRDARRRDDRGWTLAPPPWWASWPGAARWR